MTYEEKEKIANIYLELTMGTTWEELPDINSLHDCETVEDIMEACDKRLNDI